MLDLGSIFPSTSELWYTLINENDSWHSSEFYVLTSKFRSIVLSTPLEIAHLILGLYFIIEKVLLKRGGQTLQSPPGVGLNTLLIMHTKTVTVISRTFDRMEL